jgi:Zn-dependent alcohol dehydrogenase
MECPKFGDVEADLTGKLEVATMPVGAERIIAMSRHETRQKIAPEFGAIDIVTERGDEVVARIKDLSNGIGLTRCWNALVLRSR